MRKVTRKSLDELAKVMPVLSESEQRSYVGGTSGATGCTGLTPPGDGLGISGDSVIPGNGNDSDNFPVSGPLGSAANPYSQEDAQALMDAGQWSGGYVMGMGYVAPETEINAPSGLIPPGVYTDNSGYYGGFGGSRNISGGLVYDGGEGGGSSVGEGGGGNPSNSGNSLTDGINVMDSRHFTFNTTSHASFNEQLTSILRSNSVLKSLLSYFDRGYVHLTFSIEDLNKQMTAYTTWKTYESYHIVFNSQYMTEQGWNVPLNRIDNIGYDWSKVKTFDEALLVTLTHEAIHAKHFAVFHDACIQAGNNVEKTARILKEKGYSQEFIDIFIDKSTNKDWVGNEQRDIRMHEYMKNYDHGVIDSALTEYRNDFK